jgi:hypothetical protein
LFSPDNKQPKNKEIEYEKDFRGSREITKDQKIKLQASEILEFASKYKN